MRDFRLLGILLLSLSSSGCHVVDKARECTALSNVLENAQKTINSKEKGAPSRKDLEAKAFQYRQLAHSVEALKFSEKDLAAQQKALVEQFHLIETQLGKAAEVLKEAETPRAAIIENSAEIMENSAAVVESDLHARNQTADARAGTAKEKSRVVPPNRQKQPTADASGKKQRDSAVGDRIRHRGPSTKMSASQHRTESFKRRYGQASKAIETGNHQVGSLIKRFSDLCRG